MSSRASTADPRRFVVALAHPDAARRRRIRSVLAGNGYQVVPLGILAGADAQVVGASTPVGELLDVPTLLLVATSDGRGPSRRGRFAPVEQMVDDRERDQELLLRVAVLCRRGRLSAQALHGELILDEGGRVARTAAGRVILTTIEHRLLRALAACTGDVASRRSLVDVVWPSGARIARKTLDSHVRRLRSKLASIGAPLRIETVHGAGFRLMLRPA